MNFTSQICTTKEQSERLLALGLKKVTADCAHCYTLEEHGEYKFWDIVISDWEPYWDIDDENIPAWSLHRLIEMLPSSLFDWYELDFSKRGIFYADFRNGSYSLFEAFAKSDKTLYDNIIDCIEWLIKEGYFNKEYLEELCCKC